MPIIRKILILLFFISTFSHLANAVGRDSVLLRGLIYNDKNRVKNIEVKIYMNNELIKVVKARTNRFRTNLPVNSRLTISVGAEGFHTKRFIFDTNLPSGTKIPDYDFDIDIFKEEELAGINTSFLDFPVGLVSFNEKKGVFVRNKKYSKQMKKAYLKLWGEAQSKERAGFDKDDE